MVIIWPILNKLRTQLLHSTEPVPVHQHRENEIMWCQQVHFTCTLSQRKDNYACLQLSRWEKHRNTKIMHVYFRIQLDPSEIQQTDVSILKKKKTQQENGNKQLTLTIAL